MFAEKAKVGRFGETDTDAEEAVAASAATCCRSSWPKQSSWTLRLSVDLKHGVNDCLKGNKRNTIEFRFFGGTNKTLGIVWVLNGVKET